MSRLSNEVSQLVRDELRLAQAEMRGKAKKAGIGAGMFGAAGLLALYGGGVLITTAILALALAVDAWLAALIVGVVLLAAAGVAALLGKQRVQEAAPPVPSRAVDSVKRDIETVRHAGDPDPNTRSRNQRIDVEGERTMNDNHNPEAFNRLRTHGTRSGATDPADAPEVDALEADIARTRQDLAHTVDLLAAKLDIKTRIRNRVAETRDAATRPGADGAHLPRRRRWQAQTGGDVRGWWHPRGPCSRGPGQVVDASLEAPQPQQAASALRIDNGSDLPTLTGENRLPWPSCNSERDPLRPLLDALAPAQFAFSLLPQLLGLLVLGIALEAFLGPFRSAFFVPPSASSAASEDLPLNSLTGCRTALGSTSFPASATSRRASISSGIPSGISTTVTQRMAPRRPMTPARSHSRPAPSQRRGFIGDQLRARTRRMIDMLG